MTGYPLKYKIDYSIDNVLSCSIIMYWIIHQNEKGSPNFQSHLQDKLLTDGTVLESVLLEVLRLYPPFVGGRRVIREVLLHFISGKYSNFFILGNIACFFCHFFK